MPWKPKEARELMLQDQARGTRRRPRGDPVKAQERSEIRRDMKTLLELNREEDFIRALVTDYGLSADSEPYRQAVMIWRTTRKGRRPSF